MGSAICICILFCRDVARDEFGEDCLGSSHGVMRRVTFQKEMIFCALHDGDVNGTEFVIAKNDQNPVISAKEEVGQGSSVS